METLLRFGKENLVPIVLAINYILVFVLCLVIMLKNKNPVKTLSFLFALAILPVLGLVVYYFFGQDYRKSKIFEKKYILDNDRIREWRKKFRLDQGEREDFEEAFGEGIFKIYKLLKNNEKAVLTFDNEVDILINGEVKFARLRKDLRAAQHHIHMEYFVVFDDELGKELMDILCEKAREGIGVRLIYDDVGSSISKKYKRKMTEAGVRHYPFMPVLFSNSTSKLNYRDHRKIVVIDGTIGYVGGINLDRKYDNSYDNERYWRDMHLRLRGGAVGALQSSFLLSYNFVSKSELPIEQHFFPGIKPDTQRSVAVQVAASGPDTDWANIMEAYFCAINSATKHIYITTPYFMPNEAILTALATAARSGVDVRVILPYASDSWAAQYASDSYIGECLESGIAIYRYRKGFVHAKTMVVDDRFASVGTANLDYRSFALNFEINALIYDEACNRRMADIFRADLDDCDRVEPERWKNRGVRRKLKESFSRLWAPLL
ncbi:cardiolipin synthase [Pseudozobellia thermophila]|uniref:Cardiolipin synthase n=1 Tax=Pseudozobellia thermophila TaxID=192903 RepID=A0A1M6FHC9_9FLAO|nr:cardiolipin synthase [Pseudozobellia thermophila]SHI97151.1 cardiolipin synthase [Pseudozobellia thermophila]